MDQHFAQRWRFGPTRRAIAIHARDGITGIGVDEDTAVLIKNDGTAEIIGSGGVALIRCAYRAYSNWNRAARGELIPVPLKIFRILTSGELISSLKLMMNNGTYNTPAVIEWGRVLLRRLV